MYHCSPVRFKNKSKSSENWHKSLNMFEAYSERFKDFKLSILESIDFLLVMFWNYLAEFQAKNLFIPGLDKGTV